MRASPIKAAESCRTKPSTPICCAARFIYSASQLPRPGAERNMLDAFKNLTGGKGKLVQKQTDELELLIATAREERAAISAMLTTLTTRSAKLAPLGKTLEQVTDQRDRRDRAARRHRGAARAASTIARRTLEEVDMRIQALKDAANQAEQTTQKALGPDGELQQHREALQQLSSQALSYARDASRR